MKKIFKDRGIMSGNFPRQLFLIMKLTLFILITSVISSLATGSYSQNTRVTLDLKSVTVKDALKAIEGTSEFFFVYNNELINVDRKIDLNVKNETIGDVLGKIFEGRNVEVTVLDRKIVLAPSYMGSQQPGKKITGKVTDQSGVPIPGASVVVKGTTMGVTTNNDGSFSMVVPDNSNLQFSFVGMKTQEVVVGNKALINVVLEEEITGIEEVVAIGYGTVRKSDLTGSTASVKVDELKNTTPTSLQQALKGKVSGLQIIQASGDPNSEPTMLIRGMGSLGTNNGPLVIVNGIPSSLTNISPNDIESIEVLKDASATAIYGSRGTNGVVLVTTKKAVKGESKVDFQAYTGTSNASHVFDYMGKDQYMDVFNQSVDNALFLGKINQATHDAKYVTPEMASSMYYKNTPDLIVHSGTVRGYNIAVSTANEQTGFRVGANYDEIGGIVLNTASKKYGLTANINSKINKRLTVDLNTDIRRTISDNAGLENNYAGLNIVPPVYNPYNEDGTYSSPAQGIPTQFQGLVSGLGNSYSGLNEAQYKTFNTTATGNVQITFKILESLSFVSNAGGFFRTIDQKNYSTNLAYGTSGSLNQYRNLESQFTNYNSLNFNKDFGKHKINFAAIQEWSTHKYEVMSLTGFSNFTSNLTGGNSVDLAINPGKASNNGTYSDKLLSYLGRFNYSYAGKYYATLTYRADGSSKFGPDNKWAYFPSASVAWRLSEEDFINNISLISNLKLRAGWGQTGNSAIPSYQSQALLEGYTAPLGTGTTATYRQTGLASPKLQWETAKQTNIGLDLGLFTNRLSLTIDYYNRVTDNQLLFATIPPNAGFSGQWTNVGSILNRGFEFMLTASIIEKSFKWNVNANFSTNHNEILSLKDNADIFANSNQYINRGAWVNVNSVGHPIGAFKLFKFGGINPADGKNITQDLDGVTGITDKDRVFQGQPTPTYYFGLTNNFSYKNFDLSATIQGSGGNKIFDQNMWTNGYAFDVVSQALHKDIYNQIFSFKPGADNTNAKVAAPVYGQAGSFNNPDERLLEDGAFVRLQNVRLSYTLPSKYIKVIKSLTVFANGENVWTLTKYLGWDPEVNSMVQGSDGDIKNRTRLGHDFSVYPTARTITFGIQMGL